VNRSNYPLRGAVRDAVAGFDARSERELVSRQRILVELDRLADPFGGGGGPVHLTGSGIISGPRGTVLHMHRRLHLWLQPGGHLEPEEPPWEAALRESSEETGLPVRHPPGGPLLVHLDAHPAGAHFHLDLRYLLLCDSTEPAPPVGESQEVRWFDLAGAKAIADAGLVDGLRRLEQLATSTTGLPGGRRER
jgi:8-oxo-dGTP pyrophosphatase MutT (NUDIX family)